MWPQKGRSKSSHHHLVIQPSSASTAFRINPCNLRRVCRKWRVQLSQEGPLAQHQIGGNLRSTNSIQTSSTGVLVDNGSSTDIIFASAFEKMGIGREKLEPVNACLREFSGERVLPVGSVQLVLTLGDPHARLQQR